MGDIASLNINGVTYGLKDEVARAGGSSTPVIGYGETGQQYVTNTGTLSSTNTLTTWLSIEGKGLIYALYAASSMTISGYHSKTNSSTQLYVDGNLVVNVASVNTDSGGSRLNNQVCGFSFGTSALGTGLSYNFNTSSWSSSLSIHSIPYQQATASTHVLVNSGLLSPILFNNNFIVMGQVYASNTTYSRQFAVGTQYALL